MFTISMHIIRCENKLSHQLAKWLNHTFESKCLFPFFYIDIIQSLTHTNIGHTSEKMRIRPKLCEFTSTNLLSRCVS